MSFLRIKRIGNHCTVFLPNNNDTGNISYTRMCANVRYYFFKTTFAFCTVYLFSQFYFSRYEDVIFIQVLVSASSYVEIISSKKLSINIKGLHSVCICYAVTWYLRCRYVHTRNLVLSRAGSLNGTDS